MAIFSEITQRVEALRAVLGGDASRELAAVIGGLSDDDVAAVIAQAGALARVTEKVGIIASGVAARRSTRETGHKGMAQKRGHGNAVSLVQDLTGSTRADAAKAVRIGQSLLDAAAPGSSVDSPAPDAGDDATATVALPAPWHAPLGRALMTGTISSAQHDAILRGLGEPPAVDAGSIDCTCRDGYGVAPSEFTRELECACVTAATAAVVEAWSVAAEQLVDEAAQRTVEELRRTARAIRDQLDPEGAEQRYLARFHARSFRMWTDQDGIHGGMFVFDDDGAAWVRAIIDAAMRPRRGGPGFVDPTEKTRAEYLANDERTNDQLTYDLIIDTLRAGALADAENVFGTRQAGVRIVTVIDTPGTAPAVAHYEDTGEVIPGWIAAQHACTTATIDCTIDRDGNPLYLGREARLYSPKQRLTLAIRDGGCRWKGCDKPPSYCESHREHGSGLALMAA